RLARLAGMATDSRPPSSERLRAALVEATAEMDVYRTYVRDGAIAPGDRRRIRGAVSRAAANLGPSHRGAIGLLRRALLLDVEDDARALALEIVGRWQQLTGPVAAKGEEDTASYRDVRLLSRNEVG